MISAVPRDVRRPTQPPGPGPDLDPLGRQPSASPRNAPGPATETGVKTGLASTVAAQVPDGPRAAAPAQSGHHPEVSDQRLEGTQRSDAGAAQPVRSTTVTWGRVARPRERHHSPRGSKQMIKNRRARARPRFAPCRAYGRRVHAEPPGSYASHSWRFVRGIRQQHGPGADGRPLPAFRPGAASGWIEGWRWRSEEETTAGRRHGHGRRSRGRASLRGALRAVGADEGRGNQWDGGHRLLPQGQGTGDDQGTATARLAVRPERVEGGLPAASPSGPSWPDAAEAVRGAGRLRDRAWKHPMRAPLPEQGDGPAPGRWAGATIARRAPGPSARTRGPAAAPPSRAFRARCTARRTMTAAPGEGHPQRGAVRPPAGTGSVDGANPAGQHQAAAAQVPSSRTGSRPVTRRRSRSRVPRDPGRCAASNPGWPRTRGKGGAAAGRGSSAGPGPDRRDRGPAIAMALVIALCSGRGQRRGAYEAPSVISGRHGRPPRQSAHTMPRMASGGPARPSSRRSGRYRPGEHSLRPGRHPYSWPCGSSSMLTPFPLVQRTTASWLPDRTR